MKRLGKALARLLASIFVLLFIITTAATLIIYTLEGQVFSPQAYQTALQESNLYAQIPALISGLLQRIQTYQPCVESPLTCERESLSPELQACLVETLGQQTFSDLQNFTRKPTAEEQDLSKPCFEKFDVPETEQKPEGGPPPFLARLNQEQLEKIISSIATPKQMKSFTEEVISQVFAYLNGETDEASVSMLWLKEGLYNNGNEMVIDLMEAQPECSLEQAEIISQAVEAGETPADLFACRPSEETLLLMQPLIQDMLSAQLSDMKDEIVILSPEVLREETSQSFTQLANVRTGLRLTPLLPLGILFFITLLVVRTLKDWLKWWGMSLSLSGLLTFTASLYFAPLAKGLISTKFADSMPPYITPEFTAFLQELVTHILDNLLTPISIAAIVLTVIGLAMWISGRFVRKTAIAE